MTDLSIDKQWAILSLLTLLWPKDFGTETTVKSLLTALPGAAGLPAIDEDMWANLGNSQPALEKLSALLFESWMNLNKPRTLVFKAKSPTQYQCTLHCPQRK